MKRSILKAGLAIILLFLMVEGAVAAASVLSVQVRESVLRSTPSFVGSVVGKVGYGDQVILGEEKGPWKKVSFPPKKISGWIHESALTTKKIVLAAGATAVETGASGDELAIAGKGFNAEVEEEFKKKNKDMDFAWIDRMAKYSASSQEIIKFLKDGQVAPAGGSK
ncbi:MAG: SH3 domain-containing protein [Deltaproteobacteria bacterium]|nr:SH3 domain-containing protein [Deltaproteobacteria bacterium]